MVDTNGHDWHELKHGKIKRILMQEVSYSEWITDAYGNPTQPMARLDAVVDLIMTEVRLYANKLEDQVCKDHHDSH